MFEEDSPAVNYKPQNDEIGDKKYIEIAILESYCCTSLCCDHDI